MNKYKLFVLTTIPLFLMSCTKPSSNIKELDPNVEYDDVYLIMGQSNATGCAKYSFLEQSNNEVYQRYIQGNEKVKISYDTFSQTEENFVPTKFGYSDTTDFFGPEVGIAEYLSNLESDSYIIKATVSGSGLQREYVTPFGKTLKLYDRTMTFIKNKLSLLKEQGKKPRVRGLFWMQGETDACFSDAYRYEKAEEQFLKLIYKDLNEYLYDHFNFVDAHISTRTFWTNAKTINNCKNNLAKKYSDCYVIKTNGESTDAINLILKSESGEDPSDFAHYDSCSMLLLGLTAAEYLIK